MVADLPFQYLLGNVGFCYCCLRSQDEAKLVTDSSFNSFFRDVAKVEFQSMGTIQVCIWCTVLVRRTLKLLENVRRANRLLNMMWSTKPAELRHIKSYVSTEKKAVSNYSCIMHPQKNIDTTAAESTRPIRKVEQCLLGPAEVSVDMLDIQVKNEKLEMPVGSDEEHEEDIFTGFDAESTEDSVVVKEEDKQFVEALENVCEISRNELRGKKRGRKKKMVTPVREVPARRAKRIYRRGVQFTLGPTFTTTQLTGAKARATATEARAAAPQSVAIALRCEECGFSFAERRLAEEHAALHKLSAGAHVCEYCTLRFAQESLLHEHIAATHERGMACVECDYVTARPEALVEHFREEHANVAPSDVRLRRLSDVRGVVSVLRISEAERIASYRRALRAPAYRDAPSKCVACAEGFRTAALYRLHHRKHSKKRGSHRCDICQIYVSSAAAQARHRHKHYERYVCAACSYEGSAWDACVDHYWREHLPGPRYLLCDVCYAYFNVPSVYHAHTREHLTQSSCQQCSQCGKIIGSKAALVIHMASHADESHKLPVQCDLCGHIYKNAYSLELHKKRVHTAVSKKYECDICGRQFKKRLGLIGHFSRNHLKCPECQKMFKRKRSLLRHIMNVHDRVPKPRIHKCEMCEKAFTRRDLLVGHSRIHTGEKPYKCAQCDHNFTHASSLYNHVRSIHLKIKQRRGNSGRKRNTTSPLPQPPPMAHLEYC